MDKETFRLVIEPAQNGFLVYKNEDFSPGPARPTPYVFETMESLLKFVEQNFHENESITDRIKRMHQSRT